MTRLLVVGLGNPGAAYAGNRHNIGFMALAAIAERHGSGVFRARFHGEVSEASIAGRPALLLKPMTFMNESGRSVAAAAHYYRIGNEQIFVLHDELDLAAGKVRVKRGGGAAGHNGLRSIDAHIGPDYWRVRLGIGHPGDKARVVRHVLDDFSKSDRLWLEPMLDAIALHLPLLIAGDSGAFMSKVALATPARPTVTAAAVASRDPTEPSNGV